jgi:hypothetical protein
LALTGGGMTTGHDAGAVRASDDDRGRVQSVLNDAFAEGRLTRDEWEERATILGGPVTFGELARLTADLPSRFVIPGPRPVPVNPGWPPPATAQQGTSTLATAALACAIGQLAVGLPARIAAVVLGHKARRRIRQTGEQGDGMARAALVLGYIGIVGVALLVLLLLAGSLAAGGR